jgi:hypothetical protein
VLEKFWIHGAMPIQLLLVLVATFFLYVGGNYFLKKQFGKGVPRFGQAVLIWLGAFFYSQVHYLPAYSVSAPLHLHGTDYNCALSAGFLYRGILAGI